MQRVRLDPAADGDTNMSLDRALLSRAQDGHGSGRVYGWSDLWVTLGRNQKAEEALVAPRSTHWILRPTGGAAVLHGHDVTVALAVPLEQRLKAYRKMAGILVDALREEGIEAALAEDELDHFPTELAPDCFASSSRSDIVDPRTGRKICGCALWRTRSAALLQASIPVGPPPAPPAEIIRGGVETGFIQVDAERLTLALNALLD